MIRDTQTLVNYHCKRNPELQKIKDNILNYSDDEIMAMNQQKWLKLGFIEYKKIQREKELSLYVLEKTKIVFQSDVEGNIYSFETPKKFIKMGKSEILVDTNDLFFITSAGTWYGTIFTKENLSHLLCYKQASTFSQYKELCKKLLSKKYF